MDKLNIGDVVVHNRHDYKGVVVHTYNSLKEGFMTQIWWVKERDIVTYNSSEVEDKIDKTGENITEEVRVLIEKIIGEKNNDDLFGLSEYN